MRLGSGSCCRFSDVFAGSHNKGQMQVLTFNYQAYLTTGRPRFGKATWTLNLWNYTLQDH